MFHCVCEVLSGLMFMLKPVACLRGFDVSPCCRSVELTELDGCIPSKLWVKRRLQVGTHSRVSQLPGHLSARLKGVKAFQLVGVA